MVDQCRWEYLEKLGLLLEISRISSGDDKCILIYQRITEDLAWVFDTEQTLHKNMISKLY